MPGNNSDTRPDKSSGTLQILIKRYREGTLGEILEDWKWIIRYTKQYRWAVVIYGILGVLSASLSILSAVASKYTIDIITGYEKSKLGILIAITIGSALVSLGLNSLTSYVSARISVRVNNDIQAEVFSSVLDADWMSLSRYSSGDLLNRFNNDIGTVATNAVSWLPNIAISLYTFLTTFFVIWHYDHIMAVLALASAPFLLLTSRKLLKEMRQHNQTMKEINSDLMSYEAETFYNLDTIKSLGLTQKYGIRFHDRQERFRKATLDYNGFTIRMNALLSTLGTVVQMAAFCYCLYLLWTGKIVYGTMTLFLSQGTKLSSTFNKLVSIVPAFLTSSVSAHRIMELREMGAESHLKTDGTMEQEASCGFSVCAQEMAFSYEGKNVLSDAEFIASPGEIVALIGPSGEGKTTMIRLILGLIRPDAGNVFLETQSGIRIPANAELRRYFSYVPQGNTVLSGTIAENLRLVKDDATDEELEEVLKLSCAWDFVSKLPDGINSSVGERGRGFSEGQSQRLAIARAILRNAPILLFDEATSALDVATERQVLRNIMHRNPKQTCIVTTHRPSVLNMCKRVYQVSGGSLRELSEEESARAAMNY